MEKLKKKKKKETSNHWVYVEIKMLNKEQLKCSD